jgi:aminoglycoside phosphotransferase (APT) family kinase protein
MGLGGRTGVTVRADGPLDEDSVLEAVRRHAPHAGRLLAVDESGGEARAYLLDGGVVLKTQRPERRRAKTSLEKEAMILRELERQRVSRVPRTLGYGHVEGVEYLCLTLVPGAPIARSSLAPVARAAALEELGETLRRIHAVDQAAFGATGLLPGDAAPADLRTRLSGAFEALVAGWHGPGDVAAIARACLDEVPDDCDPVMLHSNAGPTHTFVDLAEGTFRGLIDFGDAYRSHPALDLCAWSAERDAACVLAGYRAHGPLPATFDRVWRAGRAIAAFTQVAKGRRDAAEAIAGVERLVGESA